MNDDSRLTKAVDYSSEAAIAAQKSMECADISRDPIVDLLDNGSLPPEDHAELELCRYSLNMYATRMEGYAKGLKGVAERLQRLQTKWSQK